MRASPAPARPGAVPSAAAACLLVILPVASLGPELSAICRRMEDFEASVSRVKTGTGARREGAGFEKLIAELWAAVRAEASRRGADAATVTGVGKRIYARLDAGPRTLLLPAPDLAEAFAAAAGTERHRWLEVAFGVADLVGAFPSEAEAVARYAPRTGPFAGEDYPDIYAGMRTHFDDTVVLAEGGVLREKILLEYKTAKSSKGRTIDGNAHERLSFQIMQYLEAATRYTRCSLTVLANGAFVRYRNKYHTNFHVQADRLANFGWFSMDYACTQSGYERFISGLLGWLIDGVPREAEHGTGSAGAGA